MKRKVGFATGIEGGELPDFAFQGICDDNFFVFILVAL